MNPTLIEALVLVAIAAIRKVLETEISPAQMDSLRAELVALLGSQADELPVEFAPDFHASVDMLRADLNAEARRTPAVPPPAASGVHRASVAPESEDTLVTGQLPPEARKAITAPVPPKGSS